MKGFLFILSLLSLIFIDISSYSASVVFIKGEGERIRNGKKTALKKGLDVKQKDIIQTKGSSTVIIEIKKGTKIKIKENSKITLTVLNNGNKNRIYLHEGGVFAKVKKLQKNERFQIQSVHTLAGVRGTQFYIHTLKSKDIWLCVNEGEVLVKENKKKSEVSVKEGEGISIQYEEKVGKPKKYKWTKDLNWNMDADKGNVEDTVDLDKPYDVLDKDYD